MSTSRLPEFVIPTSNDTENEALLRAQEEFVNCLKHAITTLRKELSEPRLEHDEESGRCVVVLPLLSQWAMFIVEAVVRECFSSLTSFLVGQGASSRIVICHEDLIQKKIMQDALAGLQLDGEKETKGPIDSSANGVGHDAVDVNLEKDMQSSKPEEEAQKNSETCLQSVGKFIGLRLLTNPSSCELEELRSFQPEPDSVWALLAHLPLLDILSATGPVYIMKPDWSSFGVGSDISLRWDSPDVDHVLEIFDFPPSFVELDIIKVFKDFEDTGFAINWTDDTHAVIRFTSKEIATQALSTVRHPSLKCRPVSVASRKTKLMLARSPDRRLPYKRRPQTESNTAKRLILSSLGLRRETVRGGKETN